MFVFLAGVSLPFSIGKRVDRGKPKSRIYARIVRRVVLLIVLGLIYNKGGLLCFHFAGHALPQRAGPDRAGLRRGRADHAPLLVSRPFRLAGGLVAGLLGGHDVDPVPEFGAGNLAAGKNLSDYLDLKLLPGKTFRGDGDPEGLLSTLPAIGTALLGVLAGQWLKSGGQSGHQKAGASSGRRRGGPGPGRPLGSGLSHQQESLDHFFVLWAGGWSLMLLGLFYLVINVWGLKRWTFPLVVIGVNPITIYLAVRFIDFRWIAENVLHRAPIHPDLLHECGLLLAWLLSVYHVPQQVVLRI